MNNMDMNWKKIAMSFLLAAGLPLVRNAQAQTTYEEMEQHHPPKAQGKRTRGW